MVEYRLVRWIGEAVVPDDELEDIAQFVSDVLSKCVIATECDLGEGRMDRVVLAKTFYEVVMKFYKPKNIYLVFMNFKPKRAEVAVLASTIEVSE